ncbi:MAG: FAD-dependent oxidoreductase, partial [Gammaproteobacteria bacterium]|nr:FAD-dependent oxidoreductase [Gammaproteobacteria bacterium]
MTEQHDYIVIGAGHNGLTCAAYLARHGHDVLVLEAADTVGGMAATREIADGYRVSDVAQYVYQLQPQIIKDLDLERHGLHFAADDLATIGLGEEGHHIRIRRASLTGNVGQRDKNSL